MQPEESEQILNGYRMKTKRPLDWEVQCRRAYSSFEKNGFLVLVDGKQVTELDSCSLSFTRIPRSTSSSWFPSWEDEMVIDPEAVQRALRAQFPAPELSPEASDWMREIVAAVGSKSI